MSDEKPLENEEPLSTLRVRNTSPTETIEQEESTEAGVEEETPLKNSPNGAYYAEFGRAERRSQSEHAEFGRAERRSQSEHADQGSAKPKKKFIMTPARMETLRKGREKRMQNISKKKEIEHKLKAEEKQKKEEIKQRVEEEFNKKESKTPSPKIEDKPKLKRAPRKPRKAKTPEPLLTLVDNQGGRTLIFCLSLRLLNISVKERKVYLIKLIALVYSDKFDEDKRK